MALEAVGGSSTSEKVTAQLYDELHSGRWPVGSKIPGEVMLAEQLRVSRPVVREAIRELARMGMLEVRHGAGTFVRSSASPAAMLNGIDQAEIRDIFEVQMAYDVQAAGMAAARRTEDDLAELEQALRRRDSAENDSDSQRFALEDSQFHLTIVTVARNPVLSELYRYFLVRLREGLYRVHADVDLPTCGHESHRNVVDAIRAHDVTGAREATYRMLRTSLDALEQAE
ncbi:FadR/GntR family transcriptional regulator [Actinopolyspora mortivallis]|uniref:GntR family transcriptional regulator n=1 Tax=Actinopolyspora mortivallis TaxID=33906 RepID=A0A2T0GX52_ACTMO|nr:FadR/GntR family transcriptional regulator [Actinopolyspora mortivallis]PRW63689.1 GntR family transcriptional regulator [Actinopolyspora mortivallis]